MTQVLISESHAQVGQLLQRMIRELGHAPRAASAPPTAAQLRNVGLLIVEPADPGSALLAETVHELAPALPILCVSVLSRSQAHIAFRAFLSKPFTFEQLAAAVQQALMPCAPRP